MNYETHSATDGVDRLIVAIPPDLPSGMYKFDSRIVKTQDAVLVTSSQLVEVSPYERTFGHSHDHCEARIFLLTVMVLALLIGLIFKAVKK